MERRRSSLYGKSIKEKSDSSLRKVLKFFDVGLRFVRAYVVYSTVLGFICILTRVWMENDHLIMMHKWILLLRTVAVLVVLVITDGYVGGINQIYDIEIDKINKPHYPMASGELSIKSAWILITIFVATGITIPVLLRMGSLLAYVLTCYFFGSLYSIPPFAFKRSTIGAILTCSVRGWAFTIGSSAAARAILGLSFQMSPQGAFLATFSTLFILVFGALKDIGDLEGDKKYNVPTLASLYGPRKVALFGFGLLLLVYLGAITTSIIMPQDFRRSTMIPAHIVLTSCLIFQAWKLERANYTKETSQSVYQTLWKLHDIEFIIYPLI